MDKYKLIKQKYIEEVNSNVSLLKHTKSGARILLFENDDDNKVFTVGFRTPPTDSTGVPHILEHSTLCGSKKFPVKDPFIELLKSSLNTFLNAMTFPDKTIYPVASCNDKDFQNLMEVYMDAVFYPNVYIHEEIFKQEGWHYELESVESDLIYNGVVYNEMKGAFSSAEQVLMRQSMHALFPDTTYGVESGGDPDFIPDLTYEQFKNFHKRFYSPANSYIILYGNMNMEEKLSWLDSEYLSNFNIIETASSIEKQKPFDKPNEEEIYYPIGKDESLENKTYYSFNATIGDALDNKLAYSFTILTYALLDAPGAPLKQALLDNDLGKDVISTYESGILQPVLGVAVKEAPSNSLEKFKQTIKDTLTNIVTNGIDKKALLSAINYFEFKYRESDFGRAPKGLVFTMSALETWLYDENNPFARLETNEIFTFLKEQVDSNYFEELIQKYLLDNNHIAYVTCNPSNTLQEEKEQVLKERLANYKASLSKDEINKLVEDTKNLKIYQSTPSSEEDLKTIPLLTKEDIDDHVEPIINKVETLDGVKLIKHDIFTNGIGYLNLLFDIKNLPQNLIPYVGLLTKVLGYVDTSKYTYQELTQEINLNTGGINTSVMILPQKDNDLLAYFTINARALYNKMDFVFKTALEIITSSTLDNEKRLYEIIAENKSQRQMYLMGAGHLASLTRAGSYIKAHMYYQDIVDGIGQYQFIEDLEKNFKEKYQEIKSSLQELMHHIFRKENLNISYTADNDDYKEYIPNFVSSLYNNEITKEQFVFIPNKKNEGFKTPAQVQYVARYGDFSSVGTFKGSLYVFEMALRYDYLWTKVRVLGGAYGCMSSSSRSGDTYYVSYRDPNLEKTINVYEEIPTYLDNFNPTEEELMKYIIGAIGYLDTPLNPKAKGDRSLKLYLLNIQEEQLKKERHEVLEVTLNDIKALKPLIEKVLSDNALCVIGNESKIEENKQIFKEIKNLFN